MAPPVSATASPSRNSPLQNFVNELAPEKALPAAPKAAPPPPPAAEKKSTPPKPPKIEASVGGPASKGTAAVNRMQDVQTVVKLLLQVGIPQVYIPQNALDGKKLTPDDVKQLKEAIARFQDGAIELATDSKGKKVDAKLSAIMLQPSIFGNKGGDGRLDLGGASFKSLRAAASVGWKFDQPTVLPTVAAPGQTSAVPKDPKAATPKAAPSVPMPDYEHGIGELIANTRGGEALYKALGVGVRDDGTPNLGIVSAFSAPHWWTGAGEFTAGVIKAPTAAAYLVVDSVFQGIKSWATTLGDPLKTAIPRPRLHFRRLPRFDFDDRQLAGLGDRERFSFARRNRHVCA